MPKSKVNKDSRENRLHTLIVEEIGLYTNNPIYIYERKKEKVLFMTMTFDSYSLTLDKLVTLARLLNFETTELEAFRIESRSEGCCSNAKNYIDVEFEISVEQFEKVCP